MSSNVLIFALIALAGTFISSVSQVLLKKAAQQTYSSAIREYLNVRVIVAYMIFVLATLMGTYAYKVIPLSMGPILDATGYIYVTIFGIKIFGEQMDRRKFFALGLIICGIAIYALGV